MHGKFWKPRKGKPRTEAQLAADKRRSDAATQARELKRVRKAKMKQAAFEVTRV